MLNFIKKIKIISPEDSFNYFKDENFLNKLFLVLLKKELNNTISITTCLNGGTDCEIYNIFLEKKHSKFFLFLKKEIKYQTKSLIDIIASDFPGKKNRFLLQYLLLSSNLNMRYTISFFIKEGVFVPSISTIFKNANWHEREVWDMFGIFFSFNIDMRRILTDYGFHGFPLRKDFPLTGFYEIFFNDMEKTIKNLPVSLAQEYRKFIFPLPW